MQSDTEPRGAHAVAFPEVLWSHGSVPLMCGVEIGLPYDPQSVFLIADHLNLSIEEVINKYYGRIVVEGKTWESEDYKRTPCPFLVADGDVKRCAIYSVRPSGCKLYPFNTDFGRAGVDCKAAEIVYAKLSEEDA